MTLVRFPAIVDGEGTVYPASLQVSLVDAEHNPVLGITGTGLTTEYQQEMMTTPVSIALVPQAQIALLGGGQTWYRVRLLTLAGKRVSQTWYVQVPQNPVLVEFVDLLGVAAIPSADLLVELMTPYWEARDEAVQAAMMTQSLLESAEARLLPDPTELPDGTLVQVLDGQWVTL